MAKIAIYGGRDPRDVPMYRLAEAAGLLRVPASTLRSWTKGQDYKVQGKRRRFQPPIPLDKGQEFLTFYNLVEAFVLSSMRRDHNVELARLVVGDLEPDVVAAVLERDDLRIVPLVAEPLASGEPARRRTRLSLRCCASALRASVTVRSPSSKRDTNVR